MDKLIETVLIIGYLVGVFAIGIPILIYYDVILINVQRWKNEVQKQPLSG